MRGFGHVPCRPPTSICLSISKAPRSTRPLAPITLAPGGRNIAQPGAQIVLHLHPVVISVQRTADPTLLLGRPCHQRDGRTCISCPVSEGRQPATLCVQKIFQIVKSPPARAETRQQNLSGSLPFAGVTEHDVPVRRGHAVLRQFLQAEDHRIVGRGRSTAHGRDGHARICITCEGQDSVRALLDRHGHASGHRMGRALRCQTYAILVRATFGPYPKMRHDGGVSFDEDRGRDPATRHGGTLHPATRLPLRINLPAGEFSMTFTRRSTLALAVGTLGATALPRILMAQNAAMPKSYAFPVDGGEVTFHPVEHASMVVETPAGVIYVDPVGGAEAYAALPKPDLIVITHEHGDHFDQPTLDGLAEAPLITNPAVHDMLSEAFQGRATTMANGDSGTALNGIAIDAVPAYNITEGRLDKHPEGRDNGYVLTIGGKRFYIAGDTEATAEFRAMTDVEVAFVPMNLPYTMDVEQAADGVAAFKPKTVFPYHHRGSDVQEFKRLVGETTPATIVVLANWYPDGED